MMARKSQRTPISTLLGFMLLTCALLSPATGQSQQTPQQPSSGSPQSVSLAHLYWYFLSYQNHLDTVATAKEAQGQDGTVLHNIMQARLGFSDADFAYIRTSSVRLTAQVQTLNAQATAIQVAGTSPTSQTQLSGLAAQREANISAEISYLKQSLSPDKIATLEAFLDQLFSQNNPAAQANSDAGQSSPAAVQQ
jgi:hypothetical protein